MASETKTSTVDPQSTNQAGVQPLQEALPSGIAAAAEALDQHHAAGSGSSSESLSFETENPREQSSRCCMAMCLHKPLDGISADKLKDDELERVLAKNSNNLDLLFQFDRLEADFHWPLLLHSVLCIGLSVLAVFVPLAGCVSVAAIVVAWCLKLKFAKLPNQVLFAGVSAEVDHSKAICADGYADGCGIKFACSSGISLILAGTVASFAPSSVELTWFWRAFASTSGLLLALSIGLPWSLSLEARGDRSRHEQNLQTTEVGKAANKLVKAIINRAEQRYKADTRSVAGFGHCAMSVGTVLYCVTSLISIVLQICTTDDGRAAYESSPIWTIALWLICQIPEVCAIVPLTASVLKDGCVFKPVLARYRMALLSRYLMEDAGSQPAGLNVLEWRKRLLVWFIARQTILNWHSLSLFDQMSWIFGATILALLGSIAWLFGGVVLSGVEFLATPLGLLLVSVACVSALMGLIFLYSLANVAEAETDHVRALNAFVQLKAAQFPDVANEDLHGFSRFARGLALTMKECDRYPQIFSFEVTWGSFTAIAGYVVSGLVALVSAIVSRM